MEISYNTGVFKTVAVCYKGNCFVQVTLHYEERVGTKERNY